MKQGAEIAQGSENGSEEEGQMADRNAEACKEAAVDLIDALFQLLRTLMPLSGNK